MTRGFPRRGRSSAPPAVGRLADESGQPITFATPGAPTLEERRRYALAVQRATTPPPLTPDQSAARLAAIQRRRELLADLGVYVDE